MPVQNGTDLIDATGYDSPAAIGGNQMSPELAELCRRASDEHDSDKLLELVRKINNLLSAASKNRPVLLQLPKSDEVPAN